MQERNTTIGGETPPSPVKAKDGMATAGMWCGIAALVMVFIPFIQFLSPILAILAIVFGVISKRRSGIGLSGIILGIIALLIFVAIIIMGILAFVMIGQDPSLLDVPID